MRGQEMTKVDVEHRADQLLAERGIARPPVPVERVAKEIGANVVFEPFEGEISGMLYQEESHGAPVIVINSLNARVRQRFTVAHEIGHLLLHNKSIYVDRPLSVKFRDEHSSLAIDEEEMEANRFAASLLMPRSWLIREVDLQLARHQDITEDALIASLAEIYGVSRQAMEYRLGNIGIWAPL